MQTHHFLTNETGAVTVDWVVLTAALVGLGLATMGVVSSGVETQATALDGQLKRDGIIRTAFSGLDPAALAAQYGAYCNQNSCDGATILAFNTNKIANMTDEEVVAEIAYRTSWYETEQAEHEAFEAAYADLMAVDPGLWTDSDFDAFADLSPFYSDGAAARGPLSNENYRNFLRGKYQDEALGAKAFVDTAQDEALQRGL